MTVIKSLYRSKKFRRFAYWYLGGFITACLSLLGMLYYYGLTHQEVIEFYPQGFRQLVRSWFFWLILTVPYLLFLLIRNLYLRYRSEGFRSLFKIVVIRIALPVFLIVLLYRISQVYLKYEDFDYEWQYEVENQSGKILDRYCVDLKQRGAHVFGTYDTVRLAPLIKNNFEWITLVPFAGQDDYDSAILRGLSSDSLRQERADSMWVSRISIAHREGFRVMFKPHIWISTPSRGTWRSDIYPSNDDNWQLWSDTYRELILHYALLAERTNVELFCIGTELAQLAVLKPDFWIDLIDEVRLIYSGELTYAANWNEEYDQITFWEHLDYIGIQAYFPLAKTRNPELSEITKGWSAHLATMDSIHQVYNRPILFTEMGYKSRSDTAIRPWAWSSLYARFYQKVSTKAQHDCYQAFFETVWLRDWFAGVHIWQWRSNHEKAGGPRNLNFTPQRKPAENVIAKGFAQ